MKSCADVCSPSLARMFCKHVVIAAAAAAAFAGRGEPGGDLRIHVPGGTVLVTIAATGTRLRGPSMLVAEGELRDGWCGGPGGK